MFNELNCEKLEIIKKTLKEKISQDYEGLILAMIFSGSNVYGLNIPESDWDIKGIHSVALYNLIGMKPLVPQSTNGIIEICDYKDKKFDVHSMELGKFCYSCFKGDPASLELLFSTDDIILQSSDAFEMLQNYRNLFLAKKNVIPAYIGYAEAQFKSMSPKFKQCFSGKWHLKLYNDNQFFIDNIEILNTYDYNYKNAMHGIRLMASLKYLLENGEILVKFNEAFPNIGRDIRKGNFTMMEIIKMAYQYMKDIKVLEEKSTLKQESNFDSINNLLYNLRIKQISNMFDSKIRTFGLLDDWN